MGRRRPIRPHRVAAHLGRREFVGLLGRGAAALLLFPASRSVRPVPEYYGCRKRGRDTFEVAAFDGDGAIRWTFPLPARGHAVALRPDGHEGIAIARDPGRFGIVFDCRSGAKLAQIEPGPGRALYGHAVYSRDGRWLFTTENDYAAGRGVVVRRDVSDGYRATTEFESFGVGPHELTFTPDGTSLVVANGGIRTHPDHPGEKLDLEAMRSSVVLIDPASGRLQKRWSFDENQRLTSLRHLGVGRGDGTIAVAHQHQGDVDVGLSLAALVDGDRLRAVRSEDESLELLSGLYTGSICFDASGEVFATSHPHAALVAIWDSRTRALLATHRLADACGIAPGDRERTFIATGANGRIVRCTDRDEPPSVLSRTSGVHWDNHLAKMS